VANIGDIDVAKQIGEAIPHKMVPSFKGERNQLST